jgi:AI-2 transport protein TqsA
LIGNIAPSANSYSPRATALAHPIEPPIRAELHVQTVCLSALTVVAIGFALWWLRPVMIPFVMAAFLAVALMPLVDFLDVRCRIPRTSAVCLALLLAVLVLVGIGLLVKISVNQITSNADLYEEQLEDLVKQIEKSPPVQWLDAKLSASNNGTPSDKPPSADAVEPPSGHLDHPEKKINPLNALTQSALQDLLWGATGVAWGVVSQSVVVLVFLFFLLLSSVKRDRPIAGAWGEMENRIRSYVLTMTALSGVTGLLVGLVLALFGVHAAVLFGLLTFLLNFIPNVGSFISIVLPIPIVWLAPNFTTTQAILAIGIPAVIQFAIGNFIQPKLMGEHMKLHPVTILISLIFWGMLWGIVGAFLAVPITSIIRIACDRHPLTKPVASLMAGKLDSFRDEPALVTEVLTQS